jgi:signal peptidase I
LPEQHVIGHTATATDHARRWVGREALRAGSFSAQVEFTGMWSKVSGGSAGTDKPTAPAEDGGWREMLRICIHAVLLALVVRTFFFQPFNIPSGSMKPTLLVGDYLFVSKLSYGYSKHSFYSLPLFKDRIFASEPKRGDVAVFKLPTDNATDYIKRVIGLPGDEIRVQKGVLSINGQEVKRTRVDSFLQPERFSRRERRIDRFREELPNGVTYYVLDYGPDFPLDNFGPYKVPTGHYFMMGDNRDDSQDSRELKDVGAVPLENFIGRADLIFFSTETFVDNPQVAIWKVWRWPLDIRWSRFFSFVR